ncbi:MAG: tetratricopeptide repeat protein, partial [Ilumatobacteraceae bacterium]
DRDDRPARSRDDRPSSGRPSSSRSGTGRPFRDRDDRRDIPARPQTAAQRKADEVHHRTGGRKYGKEPMPATEHTIERWRDDGPVDGKPRRAESGDEGSARRPTARAMAHVEATVAKAITAAVGADDAKRTIERFALALDAFERERYQDAKKAVMPIVKKCGGIPLVHEVAGLSLYRLGQWNDAADQLEQARAASKGSTTNHPVLADCYRALRRYEKVDELWKELKEASPHPSIVAEGRIVAAGALADHGDLQGAVRLMHHGSQDPRKVQEYHLREWYMLGDLYDRSGDVIAARKMFGRIAAHDPHFSDVGDRLATLGT